MQWERVLRGVFVELPKFIFYRFEGSQKLVSFFFVYVMLQALAILWGYLFNVGAILGENMSSIITMPFTQACCVLFIYVSVMGIVLQFGRATWILTWQSTQNFPLIRRIIAVECRPQAVIITVALPMLLILPSLILVPSGCSETLLYGSWMKVMCEESYLKFLTEKHPVFQRSLRISTAITIAQFIQLCLEILPRWRSALSGLSTFSTFFLGGWLLTMNFIGGMWSVEWVARHFAYRITPLSDLTPFQWEIFGMLLLIAWILWFIAVACHTFENVSECEPSQKKLAGFFERLKYTFVFAQAIVFFRACIHPNMGFVHAQLELTIINLLLPSIYVVSLIMLRMMILLNFKSVSTTVPLALGIGGAIFYGSKMTQRPHALFVISMFLFDILLRWSASMPSLSSMNQLPNSLQQLLKQTNANTRKPFAGHRPAKIMVYVGMGLLLVFIGAISGFSILSDLQKNAHWFPDATSVAFEDRSIHIHHTAVVKLHLGLADSHADAMHLDQPKYASCSNRFNGLSLVDLGLLAEAAYFNPLSNDTDQFVATMFAESFPGVVVRLPELNTKTGSKLDFFETYFPSLNTSVISVRGTDIWRFTDFIEDVKMFFEPVVFAILSAIFPTIRIWPDVTFSTLIELYSELIALCGLQHESWYYHELLEYVNSIQDRDVLLTGHSMGGGIARLVGSIVEKQSITFSPPGFVQSYSKLVHDIGGTTIKVNRANLHHLSVAVVPEYDPVTMIDAQAGLIQKISCDTPHLSMQLSCHMLEGTVCNLLEHCGDAQGRISSCKFEHKIASATDDLLPKLAAVLSPESLVTVALTTAILLSTFLRRRSSSSVDALPSLQRRGRSSASPSRRHHHKRATGKSRQQQSSPKKRRNSII
uniref:Fungal lipase-type domain-containing protein n=1 Tax=Globisporangium ultimum (strain ATCC 200006 / CBS 805.95 / DAOM BR144) TaxID=431595 RepID=K3WLR8_GLOUD